MLSVQLTFVLDRREIVQLFTKLIENFSEKENKSGKK